MHHINDIHHFFCHARSEPASSITAAGPKSKSPDFSGQEPAGLVQKFDKDPRLVSHAMTSAPVAVAMQYAGYHASGNQFILPHRSQLPPGQEFEPSVMDAWPRLEVAMASHLHLTASDGYHPMTARRIPGPASDAQLVKSARPQAHLVALLNKRIENELLCNGLTRDSQDPDKLLMKLQVQFRQEKCTYSVFGV